MSNHHTNQTNLLTNAPSTQSTPSTSNSSNSSNSKQLVTHLKDGTVTVASTAFSALSATYNALSTTTSFFGSMITSKSNDPLKQLEEYDTHLIDGSLSNRLSHADQYLDKLYQCEKQCQNQYDQALLKTKEVESKYENNMDLIQSKIDNVKNEIYKFHSNITDIVNETKNAPNNDKVLECLSKIFDFTELMRSKVGTKKAFEHIDLQGVHTTVDYIKAVEMNKTLLNEIAIRREEEVPHQRNLQEIKDRIEKVREEVSLIKKFKVDHSKVVASKENPHITGEAHLLLDQGDTNNTSLTKRGSYRF